MNFKVLDIEMLKNDNLGFTISGKTETYLRVLNVNPAGLAFQAGLKQDDYIIMINGIKIKGRDDIINSMNESIDKLNIKVIRYNSLESKDRCTIVNKTATLDKRRSAVYNSDFQSLHHNLLSILGSKVGMEITRSYEPTKKSQELKHSKLMRRSSTNSECLHREISSAVGTKVGVNISQYHAPLKKHVEIKDIKPIRRRSSDLQCILNNNECKILKEKAFSYGKIKVAYGVCQQNSSVDISNRQLSHDNFKTKQKLYDSTDVILTSPVLLNKYSNEMTDKHEFSSRNLSLRQKKIEKNTFLQYKSLSNISITDKTTTSDPLVKDFFCSKKLSNANTSSMVSLFEEELSKSETSEYIIDWKAIFLKISEKTASDSEDSLINHFHNDNTNLKLYPPSSLYRYLTYDDVLYSIFNNILSNINVNFREEILKTPTQMTHFDYEMNSRDIIKLIKSNIKRVSQLVEEYQDRKNQFKLALEKWKDTLDQYLKYPDFSNKMRTSIDSICIKLEKMSHIVIIIVNLLSRWKLSKEFSSFYQSNQNDDVMLANCGGTLTDFRRSQKKLEQQMASLIKLFGDDKSEEVLKLVNQIFSENIELDLYLPIFKNKLINDNKVLVFLETTPMIVAGQEQFV